jgi:hypothetical protein
MTTLINQTLEKAKDYLLDFGFSEDQVSGLLLQAERDLTKELTRAQVVFDTEPIDHEAVNNVLHAIKGLLFSLGSREMAEKIEALREEDAVSQDILEVKRLLFNQ